MIRVAFNTFGGKVWTGGENYLKNLLLTIHELLPDKIQPVLFTPPSEIEYAKNLVPKNYFTEVVGVENWEKSKLLRNIQTAMYLHDRKTASKFKENKIDAVFALSQWYGINFPIKTMTWIPDLQHKNLPNMFSLQGRIARDAQYCLQYASSNSIMVSSESTRDDFIRCYPHLNNKPLISVPFAIPPKSKATVVDIKSALAKFGLSGRRFIYMPNQLWKHKNHISVIRAAKILLDSEIDFLIVASGTPSDPRNPEHPQKVISSIAELGLKDKFIYLGLIDYSDLQCLMRASIAIINPSLSEGWSTPVEEAKALGIPLILSNLSVHKEQTVDHPTIYFDPLSVTEIADAIQQCFDLPEQSYIYREELANKKYQLDRIKFAKKFHHAIQQTIIHK